MTDFWKDKEEPIAFDLAKALSEKCGGFHSTERPGKVSNSELRRWFTKQSILINGYAPAWDEFLDWPIRSFVLHPNGRRITLW